VPTLVKRVLGAALALAGLGLAATGVWLSVHLGTEGAATFTLRPTQSAPVVLGPRVVNRLDMPVTVTARAAGGAPVWIGVAAPSDAGSALGSGGLTMVDGVSVRDWALLSRQDGTGPAPELVHTDLWRAQASGRGQASIRLNQANAPETVVVTADGSAVRTVSMSVAKKTWFVQALLAAISGVLLAIAGATIALTAGRPPVAWESITPPDAVAGSRRATAGLRRAAARSRGTAAGTRSTASRGGRDYQPRRAAAKSEKATP
jgi:hypothetical protein